MVHAAPSASRSFFSERINDHSQYPQLHQTGIYFRSTALWVLVPLRPLQPSQLPYDWKTMSVLTHARRAPPANKPGGTWGPSAGRTNRSTANWFHGVLRMGCQCLSTESLAYGRRCPLREQAQEPR
jgi:hypothetical protein